MIFDMSSCGGCTTCEMACLFHHKGEFIPSISSIKILEKENQAGFRVLLVEKGDGKSFVCEGCRELDIPLCMQYRKERKDLEKILKEFLEKRKPGMRSKETTCRIRFGFALIAWGL